jgi:putative radical SAM enzyme (TIGR03279 family)
MSQNQNGLKISTFATLESPFFRAGLRKGDCIIEINGQRIDDELDFQFAASESSLSISAIRNGRRKLFELERLEGEFSGLEFYEKPIRLCSNHCIFCFIDQMPTKLRSGLYIKDEDLRHSFFRGNYVTLSNATEEDLRKVVRIGLSPLYISVHASEKSVRNRMLGNRFAPPIMDQLIMLKKNGIRFHTQIVLCPGYNDGAVLKRTISDLFSLNSSLLSIAVVPVGLTKFRKRPLDPVTRESASQICSEIGELSDRFTKKDGTRKLFLSDEFYIKAGKPIPPAKYYEGYPQIENGVGLIRQLMDEWKRVKKTLIPKVKKRKFLAITSVSASGYIEKIVNDIVKSCPGIDLRLSVVKNTFFGESVTVAGLLTAHDVLSDIKKIMREQVVNTVLLPEVMFNYAGFTLDGFSKERIGKEAKVGIEIVSSLEELVRITGSGKN